MKKRVRLLIITYFVDYDYPKPKFEGSVQKSLKARNKPNSYNENSNPKNLKLNSPPKSNQLIDFKGDTLVNLNKPKNVYDEEEVNIKDFKIRKPMLDPSLVIKTPDSKIKENNEKEDLNLKTTEPEDELKLQPIRTPSIANSINQESPSKVMNPSITNSINQENPSKGMNLNPLGTIENKDNYQEIILSDNFKDGLIGLENYEEVQMIYTAPWSDDKLLRSTVLFKCQENKESKEVGVFASKSNVRPNPLSIEIAKIVSIDKANGKIIIEQTEAPSGSTLIDIKPYKKK